MQTHHLRLLADYHQFILQDEAAEGDLSRAWEMSSGRSTRPSSKYLRSRLKKPENTIRRLEKILRSSAVSLSPMTEASNPSFKRTCLRHAD
ncbi:hypothetical protein C8246_09810 [Paracidovorax avenae]|nr:hypothetical protein C8246_09810 [Paracidovorax avenae]AVT05213.1 hypothetical protein C8248_03865 [Paracidovorax avenae]AVT19421.1 hypothetical protein C7Y68_04880 [Paracidovorax avenae]